MMKTARTLNKWCSLIVTICLLLHLGTMCYSLTTGWYSLSFCKTLGYFTMGITSCHIALSMVIMFFFSNGNRVKTINKRTIRSILQKSSGILIILLLFLHIRSYSFVASGVALSVGEKVQILVSEMLYYGAIFTHLAVSASRLLVKFKILKTPTSVKRADLIAEIVCLILFLVCSGIVLNYII